MNEPEADDSEDDVSEEDGSEFDEDRGSDDEDEDELDDEFDLGEEEEGGPGGVTLEDFEMTAEECVPFLSPIRTLARI